MIKIEKDDYSLSVNLVESKTDEERDIEQAWIEEIERRWNEIESGKVKPIPVKESFAQIRIKVN